MKYIAVTNRKLARRPFLEQIKYILSLPEASETSGLPRPDMVILREKELSDEEYGSLAEKVIEICRKENVLCMLHSHPDTAIRLGYRYLHCPLWLWEQNNGRGPDPEMLGISVHSLQEAEKAVQLGADYLTAGHIFATDCKKGIPPRGLPFLKGVSDMVHSLLPYIGKKVPVYGIGGMDRSKADEVEKTGASGICIMSGYMKME